MRLFRVLSSTVALSVMCLPALAQDAPQRGGEGAPPPPTRTPRDPNAPQRDPNAPRAPGRPAAPGVQRAPLTPEQSKAAWDLEAVQAAKTINLNEEQTKHTVAAYTEARLSHAAAMEKFREEAMEKAREAGEAAERDPGAARGRAGTGEQMRQSMMDLLKAERAKLEAALVKSLTPEQTAEAMTTLGTFNPVWDVMVTTVVGFKLDAAKNESAMSAVYDYVGELGKASGNEDREVVRTATLEASGKLRESMRGILNEDQLGQFQRLVPGGGRTAPRGGEGTRPGRGEGAAGGRGGEGGAGRGGAGGAGRGGRGGEGGNP